MDRRAVGYVIFASPKSGTQWMQRLLSTHPDVQCAETRAFGSYFDAEHVSGMNLTLESYVSALRAFHVPPDGAEPDAYFRTLAFNLLDAVARTSLRAAGKSIYGEKITPHLGTAATVVARLAEYDPDLRFVHLSRDGRDVVVSGLVHQQIIHGRAGTGTATLLKESVARQRVPDDLLRFFTDLWTQAVSAALDAGRVFERYLHLRYEDLLEDTAAAGRRLLAFIGAEADEKTLHRCIDAASVETMSGGRRRGQEDRTSVVRKGVAGDWRRWFSDEQAAWFDERAGALLETLGYEPALAGRAA